MEVIIEKTTIHLNQEDAQSLNKIACLAYNEFNSAIAKGGPTPEMMRCGIEQSCLNNCRRVADIISEQVGSS